MVMNKIIPIVAIVVIIAVVAVISASSGPNLDAIIENRDCDAVRALTDSDVENATADQQLKLTVLLGQCVLR